MKRILMILEVSRKQDYIFASKKLRENAQRSARISHVTSSKYFRAVAGELYKEEENLVYAGGGHTILQFHTLDQAQRFARRVTWTVMKQFRGLELFVKQMSYDEGKTPGENLKELTRRLEEKKALRQSSFRYSALGVERLSPETFMPQPMEEKPLEQLVHMLQPPKGYRFPSDFVELAGKGNFIAVVHVDGNAMGKRVDGVYAAAGDDWTVCCDKLNRFSVGIQQDFEMAFTQTAEELIRQKYGESKVLPIRPVILAGDDVCFVTAGKLGLECARIFLEKLTALRNQEDQKPYAACAGVALVHLKYPFHQAYQLAEELCSNAKRFGAELDDAGRISALDWHIEFGQLKDNLKQIRREYRTEDGGLLSLRPVSVVVPQGCRTVELRTYDFFSCLCQTMQKAYGKIGRRKIKDLRLAFKQGELESRYFLHDKQIASLLYQGFQSQDQGARRWEPYRQRLAKGGDLHQEPFHTITYGDRAQRYCLLFDAIEMIDHCEFRKEVEA